MNLLIGFAIGLITGKLAVLMSASIRNGFNEHLDQGEADACYPPICLPGISSRWSDRILFLSLLFASMFVFKRWGLGLDALSNLFFCLMALSLAHIDVRTGLLPDVLTRPLLGMGLVFHAYAGWGALVDGLLGAALAYGILRCVFGLYHWKTGRAGMGYGDFKLAAAIGAWIGAYSVPVFLLVASVAGVVMGLFARFSNKLDADSAFPFGPFLSVAGMLILLWV